MLLELVKIAGEQDLSIEMQYSDGMFSMVLLDEEHNEVYSIDASDPIIAFNSVLLFLGDPEGYLEDMRASLVECNN